MMYAIVAIVAFFLGVLVYRLKRGRHIQYGEALDYFMQEPRELRGLATCYRLRFLASLGTSPARRQIEPVLGESVDIVGDGTSYLAAAKSLLRRLFLVYRERRANEKAALDAATARDETDVRFATMLRIFNSLRNSVDHRCKTWRQLIDSCDAAVRDLEWESPRHRGGGRGA